VKSISVILALLIISISVQADTGKLIASYSDQITVADTGTIRYDTTYSDWEYVSDGRFFQFGVQMAAGGGKDTNWIDDSFFFELQFSFDKLASATRNVKIDTLLDNGAAIGTTIFDTDADILPPWFRLRVIHKDSIGTGAADSALCHNTIPYTKTFSVSYIWR
jgi:hypothetical protein